MDLSLASSFDKIASFYDEVRPGYPDEIFDEIEKFVSLTGKSRILEIGAGNGNATKTIHERWKSKITAIEPGAHLVKILEHKLRDNPDIIIINDSFENFTTDSKYDCIISATAFHWIDPAIKFKKASAVLRDNGMLILFWNNYTRSDEKVFDEIREVYSKYHPNHEGLEIRTIIRKKIDERRNEIIESKLFSLLFHKEFIHTKRFTAEEYVKLLKTYSGNSIKDEQEMSLFYQHIEKVINNNNNTLELPVVTNLEIAKKTLL